MWYSAAIVPTAFLYDRAAIYKRNFENLEICESVVWFRADLVSGVTLYHISLSSVISEMREQTTIRFVVIPVNSYALARYSLAQSPT